MRSNGVDYIAFLVFYWCIHQPVGGVELSKNLEGKEFNIQGKDRSCECKNGGTCLYTWNSNWYRRVSIGSCFCNEISRGVFTSSGRTCQRLRDFCRPNPCARGGRCINKMGYHFCVDCQTGWGGQNCTQMQARKRTWTEDFTAVWYPNSDFQVTSISWIRLSFAQAGGRPPTVYLEYFGLLIQAMEDFRADPNFLKDCYDMNSERVACDTYRKGINYYTLVWKAQNSFLAAPYNLIFGANLENALTVNSTLWPYRMYAVKYEVKLHVYSNSELLMPVTPLNVWHQVTSLYSACLPLISFDGCSTSVKYPTKWLAHELVSIQLISRRQNNNICKNLAVEFRDAVTFFNHYPNDQSNIATRPPGKAVTRTNIDWQNDAELTFVQKKRYFFGFNAFWIATFPLRLYGSYVSTSGQDLYLELNAMCFLSTASPQTIVTVEGGDRIVDCMRGVEFTPVSSDPSFNLSMFLLRWSCVDTTDTANPNCKPAVTRWGPYTYKRLACNRILKFKMEPFHQYYKLTSASGSTSGKPYEWTVTTEIGSTEIKVLCKKHCDKVNPTNEVLVEAIETPFTASGPPEWKLYEGGASGAVLPLDDYASSTGDPWVVSFNRNALKIGTKYVIEARTTKGKGSREFETNSPPANGTCSISPASGIKGETMFRVTCQNWVDEDLPILYTFGINRDALFEPLVNSYFEDNLSPTVLFHENVSLCVTDVYQMRTMFPLTVTLTDSEKAYNFSDQQKAFTDEYRNRNYAGLVNWVVENSEMSTADPDFPPSWKVEVFKNILTVMPHIKHFHLTHRIMGSMLRLTKGTEHGNITFDEDGIQNVIIGEGLKLAAEQFREQCSREEGSYTMWDFQVYGIVSVIMTTADAVFKSHDPILSSSSNASDGTQEIHRQNAKFGVWYTLRALQIVLEIARSIMVPDQSPYIVKRGGITLLTAVGRPKTLQRYLKDLGSDGSTLILSSNTVSRMGISTYAVEVIRTENYAYHAWKPIDGQVLHIKFLKPDPIREAESEFREFEMSKGPYELTIDVGSDLKSSDIKGVVRWPSTPDLTERTLNRYVSVYSFKLPTGYSGVIVRLNNEDVGKMKIFMAQGIRPGYYDIHRMAPVNKLWYEEKVHNQGPPFSSDYYIGFISNEQPVYQYEAKVTVVRCVTYISDEWEAQKCKYMHLIEDRGSYSAKCVCYHLSDISVAVWFPDNIFHFADDVFLFAHILDNWYVAAVMSFILTAYFALLIWAKIKDVGDEKAKVVHFLRDNFPGDMHPYIIGVWTGKKCKAGTTSAVAIRVVGSKSITRTHILRSPIRRVLSMANDDWFLLYTANYLGNIKEVVLWHNSAGCDADWYCSQISVYDMKKQVPYNFVVERWFTVTQDLDNSRMWVGSHGKKGHFIHEPDKYSTSQLMGDHFITGIREKHRWTCIFTRHPRCMPTRCERLMVLATMIICTMLTGIIFFGSGDFGASDLPFAYMSLADVEVTVKSMLIGMVVSFIIFHTFEKAKGIDHEERPKTEKEIEHAFPPWAPKKKMMARLSKRKHSRWIMKWYHTTKNSLAIHYAPLIDEKTFKETKKNQKFNYWLMMAWLLSTFAILCMSFVVVLYGLRFGKKRSLIWIQSFVFGTLFDAFFMEPVKMAISAFFTAVVFQRSSIGDVIIKVDYDQTELPFRNYVQRLNTMWRRTKAEYFPMTYKRMMRIYNHRRRMTFLRRYLLYIVILALITMCAVLLILALQAKAAYFANRQLQEQLTARTTATTVVDTRKINTEEQFVNYTLQTLLPALHRTTWYNGREMKHERNEPEGSNLTKIHSQRKGWVVDCTTKLHGVPRLRQQRLTQHLVLAGRFVSPYFRKFRKSGPLRRYFAHPLGRIYLYNEDFKTHLVGWKPYDSETDGNVTQLWKNELIHVTETDIYTSTCFTHIVPSKAEYHKRHFERFLSETGASYPGHGYLAMLYWTLGESESRFNELIMNGWLDNRTRAVFVEFDLYNVNTNMFTSFVILAERLPGNLYVVTPLVDTATLLYQKEQSEIVSLSVSLILSVFLIMYAAYWVLESARVGLLTAALTWRGFIDCAIIMLGIAQVSFNISRAIRFYAFPDRLDNAPHDTFVPLYAPFYNNFKVEFCMCVFGFLVMMAVATAIHDLIGFHQIQFVLSKIIYGVAVSLFVNLIMFMLAGYMMTLDSIAEHNFLFYEALFREVHEANYMKMVMPVESTLVLCFPLSLLITKLVLSCLIYFRGEAEEMMIPVKAVPGGRDYYMDLKDPTHEAYRKRIKGKLQAITKKFNLLQNKLDSVDKGKKNKEQRARAKEEKLADRELAKLRMYEEPEGDMWAEWANVEVKEPELFAEREAKKRKKKKKKKKKKKDKEKRKEGETHDSNEDGKAAGKPLEVEAGPSQKGKTEQEVGLKESETYYAKASDEPSAGGGSPTRKDKPQTDQDNLKKGESSPPQADKTKTAEDKLKADSKVKEDPEAVKKPSEGSPPKKDKTKMAEDKLKTDSKDKVDSKAAEKSSEGLSSPPKKHKKKDKDKAKTDSKDKVDTKADSKPSEGSHRKKDKPKKDKDKEKKGEADAKIKDTKAAKKPREGGSDTPKDNTKKEEKK